MTAQITINAINAAFSGTYTVTFGTTNNAPEIVTIKNRNGKEVAQITAITKEIFRSAEWHTFKGA
jgi:hypothetical protein